MKRFILIIFILITLTGCADYKELENLATITSIGVDYIDNQYNVTYEVLNNKKESDKVVFESYTVTASGKSVSEAFINAASQIKLYPYFAHVDFLVVDEEIANNHLEELADFLLRENEIREKFFVGVTKNAQDLLNSQSKLDPVVSFSIKRLLDVNRYSYNIYPKVAFDDLIFRIKNWHLDSALPYIEKNDDTLQIDKMAYFKGFSMHGFMEKRQGYLLNLLTQNNTKYYVSHEFDNGIIEISTMVNKKNIKINDNTIIFDISIRGNLINNETTWNLKNEETYHTITEAFKSDLERDIKDFISFNINNNIDLLGVTKQIYIMTKSMPDNPYKNKKIILNLDFSIAKKGIIYDAIKK